MPKSKPKKAASKPKPLAKKSSKPAPKTALKKTAPKKAAKPASKATDKSKAKTVASAAKPVKATKAAPPKKVTKTPKVKKAGKAVSSAKEKQIPFDPPVTRSPNSRPPNGKPTPPVKLTPFLKLQRERLQLLRDTMLDSMAGVAKDTLRSRPEGGEASAFGMHQADAGSDAYDKDFALSLLSQEQDALYEIEEALQRITLGSYGICEVSGKPIPTARLEALPFARLTVECQAEFERTKKFQRNRVPVTSLFGLTDNEEDEEREDTEDQPPKPQTEE